MSRGGVQAPLEESEIRRLMIRKYALPTGVVAPVLEGEVPLCRTVFMTLTTLW